MLQRSIQLFAEQQLWKYFLIIIFEDARAERRLLQRLLVGVHCRHRLGCGAVRTLAGRLLGRGDMLSLLLHV